MPVSALSAIGSASLPNDVTRLNVRAIHPSAKSVIEAMPNASAAAIRYAGSVICDAIINRTKIGTRTIRSSVSPLATLTVRGVRTGPGPSASARELAERSSRGSTAWSLTVGSLIARRPSR